MKRFFQLALALALGVCMLSVTAWALEIDTPEAFIDFAASVNNGDDYSGETITLTADIDLGGSEWTPIEVFAGVFDGGGHSITGLYISNIDSSYSGSGIGLFGRVDSGGEVKNLTVEGSVTGDSDHVGGIVGSNSGKVTNCSFSGSVTGSSYVGGVVGDNTYGNLTNCSHTGSVEGDKSVGGVVGNNIGGDLTNCSNTGSVTGGTYVGGVVGDNYDGNLTNCYNTGSVEGNQSVGGVVGRNDRGNLTNCYNTDNVSGDSDVGGVVGDNVYGDLANCSNTGSITGFSNVGGVVGYNDNGGVASCYNTASVTGNSSVGGVVGYNYMGSLSNCYNTASVTGDINVGGVVGYYHSYDDPLTNCFNIGNVTGTSGVGGVAGECSAGTFSNCYYLTGTAEKGIGYDSRGGTDNDVLEPIGPDELEALAEKLGDGWTTGKYGHPELISNRETSDEDEDEDDNGEDDPTEPGEPGDPTEPGESGGEEPGEQRPGGSGGNGSGEEKEEQASSSQRASAKADPAEDTNYLAEKAAMKAAASAMETLEKGGTPAAAKLQEAVAASGTTILAVPMKLYGMGASLSVSGMETISAATVGLRVILDGGAAEVLIPGGFALAHDPGRVCYPLGYQKDPYGADTMRSLVKDAGAKTEVYKVGGGTLPTTVTVTLKTKLSGPVKVYRWNEETRRVTLAAAATAENGKVVFATSQLGNFIVTTGTI